MEFDLSGKFVGYFFMIANIDLSEDERYLLGKYINNKKLPNPRTSETKVEF